MSEIKVNSIKGVGASTAAITISNTDGTCTANITNKPNRNLVINGAMQVAQRGTSATNSGYGTVDRWISAYGGTDEATTQEQVSVSSGTTPYAAGFRKAFKITNGNQTSGAGAGDYIFLYQIIEAQNIANSGWNYTSATSFITLSFYVKSSVAQNFYGYVRSIDGTAQSYPFETGTLTAGQWTKITKTIPGNSNLQFDDDVNIGFYLILSPFMGTNYTASGVTLNQWAAYNDATRSPDNTSTWYTTNDATWELTGVQLEVGSVATDFEHLPYGQELNLCKRYFQVIAKGRVSSGGIFEYIGHGHGWGTGQTECVLRWDVEMRANPTLESANGTNYFRNSISGTSLDFDYWVAYGFGKKSGLLYAAVSGTVTGTSYRAQINNNSSYLYLNAEL